MERVSALLFVVAAVLGLAVGSGRTAGKASALAQPKTLAAVPGKVYAVAQSARYVAWRGCDSVGVSDAGGRRLTTVRVPQSPAFGCQVLDAPSYGLIDHDILAIIGTTVTWSKWGYGNSTDYAAFGAARIPSGHSVPSVLPSNLWIGDQSGPAGSYIVGPASDGRVFLYGVTTIASDPSCTNEQLLNSACPLRTSGALWHVTDQLQRTRVTSMATTLIAFSGGQLALVPHTVGQPPDVSNGRLFRQPQPIVLLLRMAGGARAGTVHLDGEPYALALSSKLGAALVGRRSTNPRVRITTPSRLEWFEPGRDSTARSLVVGANAEALSVIGNRIIFREGQRILAYSPGATKPTVIARAPVGSSLVGPAVSGSRLVWADYDVATNVSHIRLLNLSPTSPTHRD
ncbi:MAG TPA: hypothetical protein VI408_15905 [Gaiellaceae bacterium]